jgi:hypothetical protein
LAFSSIRLAGLAQPFSAFVLSWGYFWKNEIQWVGIIFILYPTGQMSIVYRQQKWGGVICILKLNDTDPDVSPQIHEKFMKRGKA